MENEMNQEIKNEESREEDNFKKVNIDPSRATKQCKYCKSEIDKFAKVCPYCRKKQKHTALIVTLIVIAVLMVLIIAGSIIYNEVLKSEAETLAQACISDTDLYESYEIINADEGYYIKLNISDAYGPDAYMAFNLTGLSDEEIIAIKDENNWLYFVNDKQVTYTGFAEYIYLSTASNVYEEVLDEYADYLDQLTDAFK